MLALAQAGTRGGWRAGLIVFLGFVGCASRTDGERTTPVETGDDAGEGGRGSGGAGAAGHAGAGGGGGNTGTFECLGGGYTCVGGVVTYHTWAFRPEDCERVVYRCVHGCAVSHMAEYASDLPTVPSDLCIPSDGGTDAASDGSVVDAGGGPTDAARPDAAPAADAAR